MVVQLAERDRQDHLEETVILETEDLMELL